MMNKQFHAYYDWKQYALRCGYDIEQEGSRFVAHVNGDERGCYDFGYCAGFGWFY